MTLSRTIKKSRNLTVEPIRKKRDIKSISRLLQSNPRNYLLWVMGINNGIRTNDLVKIKYSQVEGLKPGAVIKIVESKTGNLTFLNISRRRND